MSEGVRWGGGWATFTHRLLPWALAAGGLTAAALALRGPLEGGFLGLSARLWFALALAVPLAHQAHVWAVWRLEIGWGWVTRTFGAERGFRVFRSVFLPLLAARPVALVGLALADRGSLFTPGPAAWAAAAALGALAAWGLGSTLLYFGVRRASGEDHFFEEARRRPLVARGAFRHVPNAMYTLVFLGLWAVALAAGSQGALAAAGFAHAWIWVHYACLEKPDMDLLYGAARAG